MKQSRSTKIKEINLKPGDICCVTNQALEQIAKSNLWRSREDILNFLEGTTLHREKINIYQMFKEYPRERKVDEISHDRLILITDCFDFIREHSSLKERFVVLGFLHKENTYYTYFHSYYKELLDEYLTKLL